MADAKATLELTVDDSQLKALNKELAEGQQTVSMYKASLKDLEKATDNGAKATDKQLDSMTRLRQLINEQTAYNKRLADAIKTTTREMDRQSRAAESLSSQKGGMSSMLDGVKQGFLDAADQAGMFGQKLSGLAGVAESASLVGAGIATAAVAAGAALADAGRSVSAYANQFINYTKNMRSATEMYNEFNEVYRSTNYDEQKVYDMAKGFLNVGKSAKDAAELIMICADTSASLGQGVEMAELLADCFKRLATGGELTERQYKALAEAGIDLSDVQEEMRAGGERAYNALKEKLSQYAGGMNDAKQTAGEMEGDIKGNLVEIGRQTALLVDEVFGFSDMLRSFYQWLIDVTQKAINSIRSMINAFHEAKASAEDYRKARAYYDEQNGPVKDDDYEGLALREAYVDAYVRKEKEARAAAQATNEELSRPVRQVVQSIAKTSNDKTPKTGAAKAAKKDNSAADAYRELAASQKAELDLIQKKNELENQHTKILQQQQLVGLTYDEAKKKQAEFDQLNYNTQLEQEKALQKQRETNLGILTTYLQEHPFDGSAKILENLATQFNAESELWGMRLENQAALNDLRTQKSEQEDREKLQQDINTEIQLWQSYARSVSDSIGSSVTAVISGQKSMGQALRDIANTMIKNALEVMTQWLALVAILAAFGAPHPGRIASYMMFGTGKGKLASSDKDFMGKGSAKVAKKAAGGYIVGPGSSTSDSIPALLSNGEYVLNAQAVSRLGVPFLNGLNSGRLAGFAAGGAVGSNGGPISTGSNVVNLSLKLSALDGDSVARWLSTGGGDAIRQYIFDNNRNFGSEAGVW